MIFEGVNICKGGIADACGRMAIVQQFEHIISALSHDIEPMPRDSAEFIRLPIHPGVDCRISLDTTEEP
jgi:hypothetical protein